MDSVPLQTRLKSLFVGDELRGNHTTVHQDRNKELNRRSALIAKFLEPNHPEPLSIGVIVRRKFGTDNCPVSAFVQLTILDELKASLIRKDHCGICVEWRVAILRVHLRRLEHAVSGDANGVPSVKRVAVVRAAALSGSHSIHRWWIQPSVDRQDNAEHCDRCEKRQQRETNRSTHFDGLQHGKQLSDRTCSVLSCRCAAMTDKTPLKLAA